MQTIFWHCADIVERKPMEVCLNCGAVDSILFPNDGCMECGAGLEFCVRFVSKKQNQKEIEEFRRLNAAFDSPEAQKELAKIAKLIIKQNMESGGKGHANP